MPSAQVQSISIPKETTRELISRGWEIPFSSRNYISKATILSWLRRYEQGGRKIEALYPGDRGDKGRIRSIDAQTIDALDLLRKKNPKVSVPRLIEIAKSEDFIAGERGIPIASIYRLMKKHKAESGKKKVDLRKFEVQMTNDLWQSD